MAVQGLWLCKPAPSTLRLVGELCTGVVTMGASTTRPVLVLARTDEGGWFSASEDCGDGEGERTG